MNSGYGPNYRHYEQYDRRLYGRPHYGLNAPRAASIHAASSVHTYSRRSGGTLMRAGADAQSVVREERRKRAKTRCLVTIGVLLPAMAGIIGVVAYAVSADNYGRSPLSQRTPNPSANVRHRPPLKDIHDSPSLSAKGYPAENRMDAFETKSASNNVPVKRLPPIRADFDKEPELNSLNSAMHPPAIDAAHDHVRHRLHQNTRGHPTDTGRDAVLPNKVYFDREQLGEPLRHGDGTPESTFVRRPSQADPPYAQRVQPPSPPPPPPSEAVIFHSVGLASPSLNPVQNSVPVQLKPHRTPIQVLSPSDVKQPTSPATPMLSSKTNQLEHTDNEFNGAALPNGMREQQITVVDSVTNKAYVIHFLVGDNDRNPDGSIAGFDPTSPSFQQYVRDIIRQQDQQAEQQVVVLPDLDATASEGPPPASSQTSATSKPTTTTTTTTTTPPPPAPTTSSTSTTRAARRTTTTTESTSTTSTTTEPSTTSAKPKPAPTTKTHRGKPSTSSTSRNSQSRVPPIRPRVHARLQPKSTTTSSTTSSTTTTTTTSTTTPNPESSLEYDEPEEDEEIDESFEPAPGSPQGPVKENHPGASAQQSPPSASSQPQPPLRRSGANPTGSPPNIKNISKVDTPLNTGSLLQPAASMEVPSRSTLNGMTIMNPQQQQIPHGNGGSSAPSSTTTRRPSGPKPIFYSEANRRDTNLSSQNPFRPPAPGDYHKVQRPPIHPPTQRFSASNQHAVFANAPFKPPSPPAFMPLPGTFEHRLMGAESQLGLSGVHVLPNGGLLLPALGPQYPPTIPIPPPTSKPKANRHGPSSKSKSKSKRKKQKKDQRFGIELGGSHDDDDDSGITFSIGGGGGPERKHVSPLSIAKHIFLPFLPRPKVNLNKRVVFGVVLENATKLSHKKNHRSGEPEAVADISLNGHAIHDHS